MAVVRPENHVTRGLRQDGIKLPPPLPEIPETLLKALEAAYPPRCLEPRETVEDHLRYAGKVDLIAQLRRGFEERRKVDVEDNDLIDAEAILAAGERAT